MLAPGAAKHDQRVLAQVEAALDRHFANGLRHVGVGDAKEPFGHVQRRVDVALFSQLAGQLAQAGERCFAHQG